MIKSLLSGSAVLALVIGASVAFAEEKAAAEIPAPPDKTPEAPAAPAPKVDIWKNIPEVVAEVDGVKITKADIKEKFDQMIPGGRVPEGIAQEQIDQVIYSLTRMDVMQTLVTNAIAKSGFNPDDAEIKKFIKGEIAKWPPQMVQQYLEREKKTLDGMVDEMANNPDIKKTAIENLFMEKEVKAPAVTEADAKKYYEENSDKFIDPADPEDSFRASHILVGVKAQSTDEEKAAAEKKIKDILAKVKADPAKFAEIAKSESQCPSSAQGGSLGNFRKGMMVPEFEEALAKLKDGEISDVVKTQFGYHIIRRDALHKESKIEFDQVKARLIDILSQKAKVDAMREYIESLEKAAKIQYFIPVVADK